MRKILAVLTLVVASGCCEVSDGVRVGTITKFSHKGLFCKTWEGQLLMGGLVPGGQGMSANVWSFTVEDPALVETVQKIQESGKQVKIHYSQEWITGPCRSETDYFAKKVSAVQ